MYIILLWNHRANISDLGVGRKGLFFNLLTLLSPTRKETSYKHVQIFKNDGPNPLT
jgi:hypothetical protein